MAENELINLIINVVKRGGSEIKDITNDVGNYDKAIERVKRHQDELNKSTDQAIKTNKEAARFEKEHGAAIRDTQLEIAKQNDRLNQQKQIMADHQRLRRSGIATEEDYARSVDKNANATEVASLAERRRMNAIHNLHSQISDLNQTEREHIRVQEKTTVTYDRSTSTLGRLSSALKNNDRSASGLSGVMAHLRGEFQDNNNTASRLERRLARLGRSMRGLLIGAVITFAQSFTSGLTGLAGAATALAGSLVQAGTALGGIFIGAIAQAIPLVGLLAATMQRLSVIQNAVTAAASAQKAASRTSATDTKQQADAADSLASAQEAVANAHQGVTDAQRALTEARREARRELQDLIIEEKRAALGARDSQSALKDALQSGDVGAVQNAELDAQEARLRSTRSRQDLSNARAGGPGSPQDRVIAANKALDDANRQVTSSTRQLAAAQRNAAFQASEQSAAEGNLAFAMSQLDPAEKRLAKTIINFQQQAKKLIGPITDPIINSFTYAIHKVEDLVFHTRLLDAFKGLSRGVSGVFRQLTDTLTNNRSARFFEMMIKDLEHNLGPITSILQNIFVIFRNIATAAAPVLHKFLKLIADETGRWAKSSNDLGGLTKFFFEGLRQARAWYGLLKAIVQLFFAIIGVSSGSALKGIKDFTKTIQDARRSIEENPGKASNFFERSMEVLGAVGHILVSLGKALFRAFNVRSVKAFVEIFDNVLIPAIADAVVFVGHFAIALGKIFGNKAIAKLIELGVAFTFIKASLGLMVGLLSPIGSLFKTMGDTAFFLAGRLGLIGPAAAEAGLSLEGIALVGLGPIGLIVAAIIGLIAFVVLFHKQITDAFRDSGLGDALGELAASFQELFTNVNRLFGSGGKFHFIIEGIQFMVKTSLTRAMIPFSVFIHMLHGFITILNGIMEGDFGKIWAGVKEIILAPFKGAFQLLKTFVNPFIKVGKLLGHALGKAFSGAFHTALSGITFIIDKILGAFSTILDLVHDVAGKTPDVPGIPDLHDVGEAAGAGADKINAFRDSLTGTTHAGNAFEKVLGNVKNKQNEQGQVTKKQTDYLRDFGEQLSEGKKKSKGFSDSQEGVTRKLGDSRDGLKKTIRGYGSLQNTLGNTGKKSKSLGDLIGQVTNKVLKAFGAKPLHFSLPDIGGLVSSVGNALGFESGGFFGSPGLRGPDDRLIKVAGGEAILTGYHQQAANTAMAYAHSQGLLPYGSLSDMFNKDKRLHRNAPGYAKGGQVGQANFGGHPSNVIPGIRQLIALMQSNFPLAVTSTTDHSRLTTSGNVSDHTTGSAVDLSASSHVMYNASEWIKRTGLARRLKQGIHNPNLAINDGQNVGAGFFGPAVWGQHASHIHLALAGALGGAFNKMAGAAAEKIKRIMIGGPDGPLHTALQGQADTLRKEANKYLGKKSGSGLGIGKGRDAQSSLSGQLSRNQVAQIAREALMITHAGPSSKHISDLVWLANAESSYNAGAVNRTDINAAQGNPSEGIMQITGSNFRTYSIPGHKNILNPLDNMIASIRYQLARYGHIIRFSPYGRGGQVPAFDNGGVVPGPLGMPTYIKAHGGETVLPTHKIDGFQTGGVANPQKTLTDSLKTLRQAPRALKRFRRNQFDDVINTINELTREEGALDDIAASIEAITNIMATKLTLWALKIKNGIVAQVVSNVDKSNKMLEDLSEIGDDLGDELIGIQKTIAAVRKRIKRTRDKEKRQKLNVAIDGLREKAQEVQDALAQNLEDVLSAQEEAWQAVLDRFDQRLGDLDLQNQILQISAKINGLDNGNVPGQIANLQARTGILNEERTAIQAQLNQALAAGDIERSRQLQTALLENQLALLENTEAIKELDGSIAQAQSFNTSAWQLFRRAVLNGMNGLLPQYQAEIPSLQSGGKVISGGLVNLHAGEVVHADGGGEVTQHYHFSQPIESADPVTLGAEIAWKWKQQKV